MTVSDAALAPDGPARQVLWMRFSRIPCAAACFLLVGAAACSRDAVAPERAVLSALHPASERDHVDDSPGAGRTVTFEDFALGMIDGQRDWQAEGARGASACAVYDHVIDDYEALVPAAWRDVAFGRRSLRISNAVTSGCYSDQTFSSRANNVAGETGAWSRSSDGLTDFARPGARLQNHFEAEWLVMSARPEAWQPGLEVVASPARGDDHRMSWVQMADWADGLAVVFAERSDPTAPGAFQRSTVVRGLDRGRAHAIRLTIDFVDGPGNDIVRVYVDGTLRHTGGSWETYYHLEPNGRVKFGGATPAVNRVMFRTGSDTHRDVPGDAAPATAGRGFLFDRVRIATFMVATSAAACRDGGWRETRDGAGRPFENQGDCVSSLRRPQRGEDDSR